MEILTMDENLFESIYSQASAAREPMQEASLEDFVCGRRPRAALPEMLTTRRILDDMNAAAERTKK